MVTPFKDTEVSRTKRAPLNFIGSLANLLFGVVTEEQLHSYQNAVNLALSSTNRTIHVVNSLITVTKHIQLNIQENQHRISNLASFISNFTGAVSKQFSLLHNAIDQLSFQVNVEHLIVSLEQAVYYFSRQMDAFYAQRRSLEHQQLTDDILSIKELSQILAHAAKSKFYSPHPMWYFMNIQITPLWTEERALIYQAVLPFHDGESYIRYTLQSFPLPLAPDLFSTVNLQSDIAMNTATGHVLVPHSCTGKNPTICTTGPLFQSNKYPCERAIITKDEHLKAKCNISIFPSQDPILKEIGPGSYVLSTHHTKIYQNCVGETPSQQTLQDGVFYMHLNQSCLIRTSNWTLKGIHHSRESHRVHLRPVILDITPPLQRKIPQMDAELVNNLPQYNTLEDLLKMNTTPIEELPLMTYVQPPEIAPLDQYHPWFNTTSVIIIACAITGLCIVLFIIVSRLKKKFLPYQAPTIAADTEWIELPQANVVRQV